MSRFSERLATIPFGAIAEVKRRSPSAGDLRRDADPAALARSFEAAGAAAISILVDERFGGSRDDLRAARAATRLPILAKGFFTREQDLVELRAAGADAVLLILRDLEDASAARLIARARGIAMDALVEVHDAEELRRAIALGADPIGVNARDLRTFRIDRKAQLELVARAPRDRVIVAESGIENRAHAAAAELAGANAILVGSLLMRSEDPARALATLMARPLVKVCGLTRQQDVDDAAAVGADMAGFVLADSPRRVDAPLPVPETMLSVAVCVGTPREAGTDLVQLYPSENGHRGRDGVLLLDGRDVASVLDLPWARDDGRHWARAAAERERSARSGRRVMLAGGLSQENVRAAIEAVEPWCVDASRSLETSPGVKDASRVRAFVEAAR